MNHDGLVVFWNRVECLLNNMTAECIHRKVESVASNGFRNLDNLVSSAMLKASLNQKIPKAVDHQGVGLCNNCFDNIVLLLCCANLELLLKKDGCLLIVIAYNLVDNIFPVTVDSSVKETTIVERLRGGQVSLTLSSNDLNMISTIRRK